MGAIFMTRSICAIAEVGDADPADFAFALEVGHDGPALFDVFVGLGPVDLVEVDGLDLQAAEAGFALAADLLLGVRDFSLFVPDHGGLGEDVGLVRGGLEGSGDDFFGVAEAVDGGGVDPVDAEIECAVDGGDGVVVVLIAPCHGPVASADGPCAEADGGEVEVGVAELFGFHSLIGRVELGRGFNMG